MSLVPAKFLPSRYSGKLLHIDFGDCFEASMNREKFPEKVRGNGWQCAAHCIHRRSRAQTELSAGIKGVGVTAMHVVCRCHSG